MPSSTADTPDLLETALDKPEYSPGDTMVLAVTARTAGKVMLNIVADRVVATVSQDVQPGTNQIRLPVGQDWGNGGYAVATLLRPLDAAAQRMPGRAIGVQWFAIDRKAKTLAVNLAAAGARAPEHDAARARARSTASPARRRASSSPPSTSASST